MFVISIEPDCAIKNARFNSAFMHWKDSGSPQTSPFQVHRLRSWSIICELKFVICNLWSHTYWLWSTTTLMRLNLHKLEISILPSNAGGFLDGFFQAFTWPWNARLGRVLHSVLFDMEVMMASHIALKTNLLTYISLLLKNVPTS